MRKLQDGSIVDLEVVRAPTLPPSEKQHDSLLNATSMDKRSVDLMVHILEERLQDKTLWK